MICADSQRLIFAERDAPLNFDQQAQLNGHLTSCPSCATMRAKLQQSAQYWRSSTATVDVPNAALEWHSLRRKLHAENKSRWRQWLRPKPLAWIGVPAAALAALAVAFVSPYSPFHAGTSPVASTAEITPESARAEFVDVPGSSASTMVYVDNSSGWLVVWAADTPGKGD